MQVPVLLQPCAFRQKDIYPKERGREAKFLLSVFTFMSCVFVFCTGAQSWVPCETKQVSWYVCLFSWVIGMKCCACRKLPIEVCQLSWAPFPFRAASHRISPTQKKCLPKLRSVLWKSRVRTLLLAFLCPLRILTEYHFWTAIMHEVIYKNL